MINSAKSEQSSILWDIYKTFSKRILDSERREDVGTVFTIMNFFFIFVCVPTFFLVEVILRSLTSRMVSRSKLDVVDIVYAKKVIS